MEDISCAPELELDRLSLTIEEELESPRWVWDADVDEKEGSADDEGDVDDP